MSQIEQLTTFFAGATGFLGHYLVRDLLNSGRRVVTMLRAPLAESRKRLIALLEDVGVMATQFEANGQLVLVEGALPDELPSPTWGRTDEIVNSAASLQLMADDVGEPYRTNVDGTLGLLEWAARHGVTRVHHVSTAYTCGFAEGTIREVLHPECREYQTDYERSKWQAEVAACAWAQEQNDRVLTIMRPSFLIGATTDGHTTQFSGFYVMARLFALLRDHYRDPNNGRLTHVDLRIPLRPEDRQNLVPVDFASTLISAIVLNPARHGLIYHITNPNPPSIQQIKQWFEEYFALDGGYWVNPGDVNGDASHAESLVWQQVGVVLPRLTYSPEFELRNSADVIDSLGMRFPAVDRSYMFKILEFAESRGWGRRRNGVHA